MRRLRATLYGLQKKAGRYSYQQQLAAIATLLIAEAQQHQPSGGLYLDSLANVVAMQLLRNYGMTLAELPSYEGGVPAYQLNQGLDYIISADLGESLL